MAAQGIIQPNRLINIPYAAYIVVLAYPLDSDRSDGSRYPADNKGQKERKRAHWFLTTTFLEHVLYYLYLYTSIFHTIEQVTEDS